MGWQKTFSLSRRAKGCHLVTDEVQAQIKDGLKGVKVSIYAWRRPRINARELKGFLL